MWVVCRKIRRDRRAPGRCNKYRGGSGGARSGHESFPLPRGHLGTLGVRVVGDDGGGVEGRRFGPRPTRPINYRVGAIVSLRLMRKIRPDGHTSEDLHVVPDPPDLDTGVGRSRSSVCPGSLVKERCRK